MSSGGEITLAELAAKVDSQARFTRSVSIICTLAILGVMFYTLTEMFSNLPSAIVLHYMANLEKIVYEWNAIQNTVGKNKITSPVPAPATAHTAATGDKTNAGQ